MKSFDSKELKILLKGIKWNQLKEKGEKVWTEVIKKVSENKEAKDFLQIILSSKQIKGNFRQ